MKPMEHIEVMARYGIGSLEPVHSSQLTQRFGDCALRLVAFEPRTLKLVLNESPADDPELCAITLAEQADGRWLPVSSDYMRFTVDPDDDTKRTIEIDEQPVATPAVYTLEGAVAAELVDAHQQLARAVRASSFWNV